MVEAEEAHDFAGRERKIQYRITASKLQTGYPSAKQRRHLGFVRPKRRFAHSGRGATKVEMIPNIWPTKPCGVQFAIATTPSRRHTRSSSLATTSGRGANMAPATLVTT